MKRVSDGTDIDEKSEPTTLANEAYDRLREDIVNGFFPAGEPLRLEALRARYGYSFSPLREALNRLRSERLVELSALRGFRMSPLSLTEMWDAIDTRIHIEGEALRLSMRNGGYDWEARIVGAFHSLSRMSENYGDGDSTKQAGGLEQLHHDFHFALISASRSLWLNEFAAQLYAQTERYRRPFLRTNENLVRSRDVIGEHKMLMDISISRDEVRAVEFLGEHYRRTGKLIESQLQAGAAEIDLALAAKPTIKRSRKSAQ